MLSPNPMADRFSQQPPDHSVQQTGVEQMQTLARDASVWQQNTPIENNPLVCLSAGNALSRHLWKFSLFTKHETDATKLFLKGSKKGESYEHYKEGHFHFHSFKQRYFLSHNLSLVSGLFHINDQMMVNVHYSWEEFVCKGSHSAHINLRSCLTWSVLPTNQRQARLTFQRDNVENHCDPC